MSTSRRQPGRRARLADGLGKDRRATVWQIVAVDRSNHHVVEVERANRVGDARRFAASTAPGRPCDTVQYEHARVQTSPRIMKVAVPWFQHSPMFGHCASSHTVWSSAPASGS